MHHELMRLQGVLGATAFHRVGGKSPGRTYKTKKGRRALSLFAETAEDLLDERHLLLKVLKFGQRDLSQIFSSVHRCFDDGSFAPNNIEFDAKGGQWRQNITEHNHAVRTKGMPRLKAQFDCHVWSLTTLAEGILLRVFPERSHVATSLAHEPHRWAFRDLTARSSQQDVVLLILAINSFASEVADFHTALRRHDCCHSHTRASPWRRGPVGQSRTGWSQGSGQVSVKGSKRIQSKEK
mmetsp:Transcript_30824/g.57595  ORF Transcript_30824/g.57595 Transcript_30824/m.57595 type:complete len:238 (-) Transcript_30824:257-970(-)